MRQKLYGAVGFIIGGAVWFIFTIYIMSKCWDNGMNYFCDNVFYFVNPAEIVYGVDTGYLIFLGLLAYALVGLIIGLIFFKIKNRNRTH
jgi:hypothetical protein